jgi:methionyl-tRNA formyltransferase
MTRITFFGTPEPAAKALRALVERGHDVVAVYTRPDRASGRSKIPRPTPVKEAALDLGLPVHTPANLRGDKILEELASTSAEIFVVLAYGRILPPAILDLPPRGVLNVHPSLLPVYRGSSPVVTAILEGASETGVSVMLLDEGMDTGPIVAQSEPVPITDSDTADELTDRLFTMGVHLMVETIPAWERGDIEAVPQDDDLATVTSLVEKAHGELDFTSTAVKIDQMIRAYHPWPGTFTRWGGKLLKILEASVLKESSGDPGTVSTSEGRLLVATAAGSLDIKRLQLEGRGPVTATEFLSGYSAIVGTQLPDGG